MPYKSMKQEKFAHTEKGMKAFGKKNIDEFDKASKGLKLPEVKPEMPKTRITHMLKPI